MKKLAKKLVKIDGHPLLVTLEKPRTKPKPKKKAKELPPLDLAGPMSERLAFHLCGGLSWPRKMPCPAYNLPTHACNVGWKLAKVPGSTCEICYADRGNYRWPNTVAAMERRLQSLKNDRWVEAMVYLLKCEGNAFFRWHDSGDVQNVAHLRKICLVATLLPGVAFWLPTREAGIIQTYQAQGGTIPPNLTVRLSAYFVDAPPSKLLAERVGAVCSTVTREAVKSDCPAPRQGDRCMDCRRCWDKNVPNVAYLAH
jgi:hypothetical protein